MLEVLVREQTEIQDALDRFYRNLDRIPARLAKEFAQKFEDLSKEVSEELMRSSRQWQIEYWARIQKRILDTTKDWDKELSDRIAQEIADSTQNLEGLIPPELNELVGSIGRDEMKAIAQISGSRIKEITDQARQAIMDTIRTSMIMGKSLLDTVRSIRLDLPPEEIDPRLSRFSVRAETIFRTETFRVYSSVHANRIAKLCKAIPGSSKTWWTANDDRVRPDHAALHGKTIPCDQYFLVGGFKAWGPGDPGLPAKEVINCRCILLFKPAPTPGMKSLLKKTKPFPTPAPRVRLSPELERTQVILNRKLSRKELKILKEVDETVQGIEKQIKSYFKTNIGYTPPDPDLIADDISFFSKAGPLRHPLNPNLFLKGKDGIVDASQFAENAFRRAVKMNYEEAKNFLQNLRPWFKNSSFKIFARQEIITSNEFKDFLLKQLRAGSLKDAEAQLPSFLSPFKERLFIERIALEEASEKPIELSEFLEKWAPRFREVGLTKEPGEARLLSSWLLGQFNWEFSPKFLEMGLKQLSAFKNYFASLEEIPWDLRIDFPSTVEPGWWGSQLYLKSNENLSNIFGKISVPFKGKKKFLKMALPSEPHHLWTAPFHEYLHGLHPILRLNKKFEKLEQDLLTIVGKAEHMDKLPIVMHELDYDYEGAPLAMLPFSYTKKYFQEKTMGMFPETLAETSELLIAFPFMLEKFGKPLKTMNNWVSTRTQFVTMHKNMPTLIDKYRDMLKEKGFKIYPYKPFKVLFP